MAQIKYVDLHCDTLTQCAQTGGSLVDCPLQTNVTYLKNSGCAAQCFAVFTDGAEAADKFREYLAFFANEEAHGHFMPVRTFSELEKCIDGGGFGAILTVENLGFIGENTDCLETLYDRGVRMASLVWNNENSLAYPNVVYKNGVPQPDLRRNEGLKEAGRLVVRKLDELKIIIDISHLSDGGAEEILRGRKIPLVASHSNAAAVCGVPRNLTDGLIKKIASCGGVAGINFCKKFVGEGDMFEGLLRHIRHFINVGGEDVLALGSDFDGIPAPDRLEDCTHMPQFFGFLQSRLKSCVVEKLAYKNFARVFKEVCG